MDGEELADPFRGRRACIGRRLDRADVAAYHDRDQSAADMHLADQGDIRGLDHGVGRFDRADQAFGFHHAECL